MATYQLPDRVSCYRHSDHLTDLHCPRCGRPACFDCLPEGPATEASHCPTCSSEIREPHPGDGHRRRSRPVGWSALPRLTPVVAGLIAANAGLFVLTSLHRQWEFDLAQIPPAVAQGQVYRLLTAAFVHVNLAHLLFNLAALFAAAPAVEEALGHRRFLVLYLLAALGGSVFSFVLGPVFVAGIGASGAIFGVFGAWFSLARAQRSETAVIVFLIAIMLAYSFYDPGIDWRAHVGGLVTGLVVAAVYAWGARRPAAERMLYEAAVAVAVLSLSTALVVFRATQILPV